MVYATGVMEYGMLPSTGTVGDSYDNAMAESADGAYRTELVWRRRPFADLKDLELATFRWVSWRGLEAPAPVPGLQDTRSGGNRVLSTSSGTSRPTVRAEQKSGHSRIQLVSATAGFGSACFDCSLAISSSHTSLGVLYPRSFMGVSLISPTIASSSSCVRSSKLVPLGR